MPFDTQTRNRLARLVTSARQLIASEFTQQLQSVYGIAASGEVTPLSELTHLDEEQRALAELLRDRVEYLKTSSTDENHPAAAAVDRFTREQAFTVLNRLAALRMAENRGFILESVGRGYQSKGFQVYSQVAGGGLGDTYQRYRRYLFCLFDELAVDLGLFDRRSPAGLLFPRENALLALFQLINAPEISTLWAEDETIGWIYQYYNDEAERKRMREQSAAPRNSRELAVRNQFFTPRYVVEFLVDNTLGRIWYEARKGDTKLKEVCGYLVRRPAEFFIAEGESAPASEGTNEHLSNEDLLKQPVYIPHRPMKDPRDLKILDPACGSGHFLLYAFDILETVYEEAWSDERQVSSEATGRSIRADYPDLNELQIAVPELIIRHNLHGIDIDLRACQIAALALWLRVQRTYQHQSLKLEERPNITRSNIVCAEPMPGERALLERFVVDLQPKVLGQLVQVVFEKMKLAGEAGALLKIEDEIGGTIAEAKRLWLAGTKTEQTRLFAEDARPEQTQLGFDLSGITDEAFWDKAEEQIYAALEAYAEQAEIGDGYQRRLFASDTARGFAFIDLCRLRYDVTLMNPPFGDASLPSKPYIEQTYLDTSGDVYKAFVESFQTRLVPSGYLGIISSRAGFFLSQSEDWRTRIVLRLYRPVALADLGIGVLDAMVEVAAYVVRSLSRRETYELTMSLLPMLEKVSLDRQQRFSLPKWQTARNGLKRHQAEVELRELEAAGFIQRCPGDIVRYRPLWSVVNAVIQRPRMTYPPLVCVRAIDDEDKSTAIAEALSNEDNSRLFVCNPISFSAIPGSPFTYWIGDDVRLLFQEFPPLEAEGRDVQSGASTMDDFRFLRLHWEVDPSSQARSREETTAGKRWVPLAKGGAFSRYYSDWELVIDWENDGASLKTHVAHYRGMKGWGFHWAAAINGHSEYFRPGLTWPRRSQSGLSVRALPAGCIFGDKGPAIFAPQDSPVQLSELLAVTNSFAFRVLVSLQMAFGSYEVGVLERTPIPRFQNVEGERLGSLGQRAWMLKRRLDACESPSHAFLLPAELTTAGITLKARAIQWATRVRETEVTISQVQNEIDDLCFRLYGLDAASRKALNRATATESPESIECDNDGADDAIDTNATGADGLTNELLDYLVGGTFGRWDIRFAAGEKGPPEILDPFTPLPACPPGMLLNEIGLPLTAADAQRLRAAGHWDYQLNLPWEGILVDDPRNENDVVCCVREALKVIWKDRSEAIEQEACDMLGVRDLGEYIRKPSLFFADHLRRYSGSRRQAPLYWPLSTPSGRYTLWLYYPRLTAQTLHQCVADFLTPKLKSISAEIQMLRSSSGSQSRLVELQELKDELNDMQVEIERIIKLPYVPNLNDGVLVTASPLWKLFRLPRWQKDLKTCWEELQAGVYDWAHLAHSIWPDRVREKCKSDRSIAIAHNLEHLCEIEQPKSKTKKNRAKQEILVNESAN
jgi:hypothetical protein